MKMNSPQRISFAVMVFLSLVIICNRFLVPRFNTHDGISLLSWDVFGYYLYLPASIYDFFSSTFRKIICFYF